MIKKTTINYDTTNNKFKIDILTSFLPIERVICDYEYFVDKCKVGCKNYNKKYSCPPLSESFEKISKSYSYIVVNALKIYTIKYKSEYNTLRMINVIEKSVQRKIFDNLCVKSVHFLENGSCRLCKICNYQKNLPCKYPSKARCSLEASGVNVNKLVQECFNYELQWYKKGTNIFPEHISVVGGILTNSPEEIIDELDNCIVKLYFNTEIQTKLF